MGSAPRRGRGARVFPFLRCGCHATLPRVLPTPFLSEVPPCHRDARATLPRCTSPTMHTTPQICGHSPVRPRRRSAYDRVSVTGQIFQSRITAETRDGIQPAWRRSFPWLHAQPGSSHVLRSERERSFLRGAAASLTHPRCHRASPTVRRRCIVCAVCAVPRIARLEVFSNFLAPRLPTAPHIISTRVIPVAHRIHLIVSPRCHAQKGGGCL